MAEPDVLKCSNCPHEWVPRKPLALLKQNFRRCPKCKVRYTRKAKKGKDKGAFKDLWIIIDEPTYFELLSAMAEGKKKRPDIVGETSVSDTTSWRRMRDLIDAGLVDREGRGKSARFFIDYEGMWRLVGNYIHAQLRLAKKKRKPRQDLEETFNALQVSAEPEHEELHVRMLVEETWSRHDVKVTEQFFERFYTHKPLIRFSEVFWKKVFEITKMRIHLYGKKPALREVLEGCIYTLGNFVTVGHAEQQELKFMEKRAARLEKKAEELKETDYSEALRYESRANFLRKFIDNNFTLILPDDVMEPLISFTALASETLKWRRLAQYSLTSQVAFYQSLKEFSDSP